MQETELQSLTHLLLLGAFALSVAFGALAQRFHFCTMGAIADVVTMGDWSRMRMWVLAIAVAQIGFSSMVGLGWVQAQRSIYASSQLLWLSSLLGGALFGFGMVLASGCGSKNLVRLGAGSLKSLVVVLALGVSALATLRGIGAVLRVATVDRLTLALPSGQDLPSLLANWLALPVPSTALCLGLASGLGLMAWVLRQAEGRRAEVWLGGLGIGGVIVALWYLSGQVGHVLEHPLTLEETFLATNSHRMEALSTVAPLGYVLDWLLYFSDSSKVLSMGMVSVPGVLAGSFITAKLSHSFRWEGFANAEDLAQHLLGAVLMGFGGVVALGCTVGQGLSGISTLSLGSMLALLGIVSGALAALRYQYWRMESI
ncbi:transporter [Paucibacter sp. KBW04]|uniref:YeeE/YedE family protein n=1 Tax=Paucibacter sp. KBW04 TaxID=2153361 RepID=UPI000F55C427|nr:YeeE/YedE family protein [Paucibacter sp. KBW04]RQO54717.1 transporter [Paucibacter sp. KBW04]